MLKRLFFALLVALIPTQGFGQASVLQGGSFTPGQLPVYSSSGGSQPIIQQSGPASGTGVGIKEFAVTARGTGTAPYVGQGSGYLGSIGCFYDGPITSAAGYHQLCLSPNATGNIGLLSFNAFGGASALPLVFNINGVAYQFPFSNGFVVGPPSSTVNDLACWNNTAGTLLKDCGAQLAIGGTNGQVQYNNSGALGGFTVSGDGALVTSTGVLTISKIGGVSVSLGGTLTTAGSVTFAGAFGATFNVGGTTSVTLPTSGTLATLAGSEAFTNKTYNGNTWTAGTGTLTIGNGKTFNSANTITLTATDGSTLAIGTGGTLGTAAFTAASAYVPSGTQIKNTLSGNVSLTNTGTYFDGPSIAQGSSGTWYACGTVTMQDTNSGSGVFNVKLWDGTTVIASASTRGNATSGTAQVNLCGYLTSPAGNIRMSVNDATNASSAVIGFNLSGNSADATISAFRVQ